MAGKSFKFATSNNIEMFFASAADGSNVVKIFREAVSIPSLSISTSPHIIYINQSTHYLYQSVHTMCEMISLLGITNNNVLMLVYWYIILYKLRIYIKISGLYIKLLNHKIQLTFEETV